MPDDYHSDASRAVPNKWDPSRGYQDDAQQKAARNKAFAQSLATLTGRTPDQFRSNLAGFAKDVMQQQIQAKKEPNPPPPPNISTNDISFDPGPLIQGAIPEAPTLITGGNGGSSLLWSVESGTTSWKILSGKIIDFYGVNVTISNLGSNVSLNPSGDVLYVEIPYGTYPAVTTATIKAVGGTTLPYLYEYVQTGSGSGTINTPTFIRVLLSLATASGSSYTLSPQLETQTIYLQGGAPWMVDSSGSNGTTVAGLIKA